MLDPEDEAARMTREFNEALEKDNRSRPSFYPSYGSGLMGSR